MAILQAIEKARVHQLIYFVFCEFIRSGIAVHQAAFQIFVVGSRIESKKGVNLKNLT